MEAVQPDDARYVASERPPESARPSAFLRSAAELPAPTTPGLLVYDMEGLCWHEAETMIGTPSGPMAPRPTARHRC